MAKAKKPSTGGAFDKLKWLVVVLILAAAVAGNVYFAHQFSAPIRAAGVIVLVIIAVLIAVTTTYHGAKGYKFIKDARMEMRKVVWPTRQETVQSTVMVIIIVVITALILWGVDSVFALLISNIVV